MTDTSCVPSQTELKFQQLGELIIEAEELKRQELTLGQSLADDIADGARTGDEMFDFMICTNNGEYDPHMPDDEYYHLLEMVATEAGTEIFVCQMAYFIHRGQKLSLWTIYLAQIREGEILFRPDEEMMSIPVESGYLKYQEVIDSGQFKFGWHIVDSDQLTVGCLDTADSHPYMAEHFRREDVRFVPQKTPCWIERHPYNEIQTHFGIDPSLIEQLNRFWLRSRRKLTLVE